MLYVMWRVWGVRGICGVGGGGGGGRLVVVAAVVVVRRGERCCWFSPFQGFVPTALCHLSALPG